MLQDHLWVAKIGPIIWGSLINTFFSCFANPAAAVILSKAVGQEEQASAQAAYQLVQRLSGATRNFELHDVVPGDRSCYGN
jgi:hypothetical protein